MTGNGNGNGGFGRAEVIQRADHGEIARWLLCDGPIDYDHASNDTLATLAAAHAQLAIADALGEMMMQTAMLAARGYDDD